MHDLRHTMAVRTLLRWYRDRAPTSTVRSAPCRPTSATWRSRDTYWYLSAVPELMALTAARFQLRPLEPEGRHERAGPIVASLPALLQDFFCQRLIAQRNVSAQDRGQLPRRVPAAAALRASRRTHTPPVALTLADLDAPLVLDFLDHLEKERGNSRPHAATLRLDRHPLLPALRRPSATQPRSPTIQRVLAIPTKRFDRPMLGFLSREEMQAMLAAPDRSTWSGQRDHVMLATLYNTGARVSEIIGLRVADVDLDPAGAPSASTARAARSASMPLWNEHGRQLLSDWLARVEPRRRGPLFPNRDGRPSVALGSRAAPARWRSRTAAKRCPSLRDRRDLAAHAATHDRDAPAPVGRGHHRHRPVARPREPRHHPPYLEADLAMKERALQRSRSRLTAPAIPRHRPPPGFPRRPVTMRSRSSAEPLRSWRRSGNSA